MSAIAMFATAASLTTSRCVGNTLRGCRPQTPSALRVRGTRPSLRIRAPMRQLRSSNLIVVGIIFHFTSLMYAGFGSGFGFGAEISAEFRSGPGSIADGICTSVCEGRSWSGEQVYYRLMSHIKWFWSVVECSIMVFAMESGFSYLAEVDLYAEEVYMNDVMWFMILQAVIDF